MATTPYPKIPLKAWRDLRARAASAPSTKFTAATVAALMGMSSPKSAANNTVAPMRRLGLIADDGSLTPRGHKWRVDASYADACHEILEDVYPSDLTALTDDSGAPDPIRVRTWFDHKGFGDSNARQMASTYVMIASKKLPEEDGGSESPKPPTRASARRSATSKSTPTRPMASAAKCRYLTWTPAPQGEVPAQMFILTSRSTFRPMLRPNRSTRSSRAWRGICTTSELSTQR